MDVSYRLGCRGVIGFLVSGSNVIIPANHRSIVGVTLVLVGATYHLLLILGFNTVLQRLMIWQAWIDWDGQLLQIIGLAWSSGV